MPANYPTKLAATKLQISPNTLRNWSDQYSAFLSESARPGYKPERRFTEKDLTILTYVKQLRSEGLEQSHIIERLQETAFQDVELLEPETTELQQATTIDDEPQALPAVQEESRSTQALILVVQELQRQVGEIQSNRWLDTITAIGLGFTAGLLFCAILIGLAWLYGGG